MAVGEFGSKLIGVVPTGFKLTHPKDRPDGSRANERLKRTGAVAMEATWTKVPGCVAGVRAGRATAGTVGMTLGAVAALATFPPRSTTASKRTPTKARRAGRCRRLRDARADNLWSVNPARLSLERIEAEIINPPWFIPNHSPTVFQSGILKSILYEKVLGVNGKYGSP